MLKQVQSTTRLRPRVCSKCGIISNITRARITNRIVVHWKRFQCFDPDHLGLWFAGAKAGDESRDSAAPAGMGSVSTHNLRAVDLRVFSRLIANCGCFQGRRCADGRPRSSRKRSGNGRTVGRRCASAFPPNVHCLHFGISLRLHCLSLTSHRRCRCGGASRTAARVGRNGGASGHCNPMPVLSFCCSPLLLSQPFQ